MSSQNTPRQLVTGLALASALACVPTLSAQGKDVVILRDGSRQQNLQIQSATSTEVLATDVGGELKFAFSELSGIEYANPPAQLDLARAADRKGDYALAATLYEEAAAATERELPKSDYEFQALRARAQAAQSDPNEAADAADQLAAWIGANNNHFRIPEAMLWQGRSLIAADAGARAVGVLTSLADRAQRENWPAIWQARGKLQQGFAEMKSNGAAARTTFRNALSLAQRIDEESLRAEVQKLTTEATLAVGESLIAEGSLDEAKSFFESSGSNDSLGLTAARQAGLGEVLYLQANESGDVEQMRAAEMALATAITSDPAGAEISAKSLYFMGKLLLLLGDERERNVRERARAYFSSVARHYGTTRWAARAREELDG